MTNVGIAFGGYHPLHQGHLDVIMQSKKENDISFVFVCGYDGDERGVNDLPLVKRFRIIKNFLSDDTLRVLFVNDTDLGIDESMCDGNWQTWMASVYEQIHNDELFKEISKNDTNVIYNWYVGEESYADKIAENNPRSDCDINVIFLDRTNNLVSGTLCRERPLQYWNKISAPFRAYYSHNILITGTASEGKTTLTKDIGKYFNLPYSYEKGRDICKLKPDNEFTVKDFIYNIYEQNKYNEELICSAWNPGVFVSDTDNLVTLMYAKFYAERDGFILSEEEYNILYNMALEYNKSIKWNKIFLIKPSAKPIVDDGERYMADSDYEIRYNFYCFLKQLYEEFGLEYEELDGGYYNNFIRVKEYIEMIYGDEHE
ncbi:MAG: AAA family ATPase [Oscillospiraceae bacterium]|nr:AAA family ATPase [Candidatus Limimonas egerieequi]